VPHDNWKVSLGSPTDVAPRHRMRLDFRDEWSVGRGMRNVPKRVSPEAITAEIARLSALPLEELKAAWATEFRRAPPKGLWRDLLLRTLAWRIQEKGFGGHDKATLKLLEAYGQKRAGDQRAQRLKAGTVLIRDFGGIRHRVTILPEGFVWQDKTYSSLSAISKIITGTNWNGPRFFGLREAPAKGDVVLRESAA
jgi:DUF2924 family protein